MMTTMWVVLPIVALVACAMPCKVPMMDDATPAIFGTGSSAIAIAFGIRKPTPNM